MFDTYNTFYEEFKGSFQRFFTFTKLNDFYASAKILFHFNFFNNFNN